ncbi:Transcription factor A, mitochondrial [Araneus ventricosus]|uniref:Transcription factor A, mitochondrial n=1 Tax=Araneus ventricosus TaxID=182803 RepID=A0A4Y2S143_ARAVE|nr:Transcription factor A, mitochondrial [Araneus ventricosus]GBN81199.1 Transcription factor A, mitochondrial [Araneus ventricosus]
MALLRGIVKSSECFLRNPSVALQKGWNFELSYSAKKAVNIPPAPKKPLTAYMIFCKDNRKELLKQNPTLTSTEQIKKLAAQWNCLSLDMKEPYENKARESTVLYGEAHKRYYENLTEEQRQEIALEKAEKKEARRLLKLKKALKEAGVPKSPIPAYALFVQSQAKDKNIKDASEFIKAAAEKWKTLSDDEKKKFEEQAHKDKIRFNNEMEKWKKKMVAEGKDELLHRYEDLKGKGKTLDIEEVSKRVRAKKEVAK